MPEQALLRDSFDHEAHDAPAQPAEEPGRFWILIVPPVPPLFRFAQHLGKPALHPRDEAGTRRVVIRGHLVRRLVIELVVAGRGSRDEVDVHNEENGAKALPVPATAIHLLMWIACGLRSSVYSLRSNSGSND